MNLQGRSPSHTKRGPGRQHRGPRNPAGTKLVKRIIRRGGAEHTELRRWMQAVQPGWGQ